ncbi:unnamed protein product [Bursaphelenchus okinawaensis]|uniref:Uncharacterized protein n=1 Tax=Bursaphelenchus okinawaensis TaxID=465554 RepID=A0A811JVD2_9BILA|nr:unnamed protein product [Bursaphelenchus okinawaensis]CAG9084707.1 unnamed protein product [Bursaphelenchus okinawaensis]
MPSTTFLKPAFIVVLIVALAFTAASLFSPAWRKIDNYSSVGLVTTDCNFQACWWYGDNRPDWEKPCLALMIVFVPGAHCGQVFVCVIALAAIVVTLAIYGAKSENAFRGVTPYTVAPPVTVYNTNEFGYSYWLALIAAIFMAIATAIAASNAMVSMSMTANS